MIPIEAQLLRVLLLRDAWETYGALIEPTTLPTTEHRRVFDLIAQYHTRDLGMPNAPDIDVDLLWYFLREKDGVDSQHSSYQMYLELLAAVKEDTTPVGVARDLITDYVRGAGLGQLAQLSAKWDEMGSGQVRQQLWQRAKELAQSLDDIGPGELRVQPRSLRESTGLMEEEECERVPMGVPKIDAAVGGGFPAGKLMCAVAPPGVGKTRLLVNIGAAAIRRGQHVVHATLEIDETEVARWYYSILTGIPYDELRDSPEARARAEAIWQEHPEWGDVIVADYSGSTCHVGTLRRFVKSEAERLASDGKRLAVFLLDYLALMDGVGEDRYSGLGVIGREVRKLLKQYGLVGWTAAQANRAALIDGVTKVYHIADSMEIPRIVDALLMLSQNEHERHFGEFRMSLDKNRFGSSNPTVTMDVQPGTLAVHQRGT